MKRSDGSEPDKPAVPKSGTASKKKAKEAPAPSSQELTSSIKAAGALVAAASLKRMRSVFDELLGALEEGDKKPKKRKKD